MEINNVKNNISADIAAQQAQRAQRTREAERSPQEKPVEQAQKAEFYQAPDEYSPREPEQPSGRYWMEPGEDGPKMNFSDPEKAEGKPVNVTTMNTDDVDREIERLRKKVEEMESQTARADGPERERLEKQLKAARQELEQKDNDGYRRSHAKIS